MKLTQEQFERAFSEFQLFGPRRSIPVEERWREVLPDVNLGEFAEIKNLCKEIEDFALGLAEQVRDRQISDEIAQIQLAQEYPFLTQEQLGHTWSQAMYFSFK